MSDGRSSVATDLPSDLAVALARAAADLGPFAQLLCVPETDSTNDVALALSASGAPEGTAILADQQHAGRGRRGRTWFSPPGAGVYLSVVLRSAGLPGPLSIVTLVAGVAVAEAVAATTGLPIELKWPNDLVIGRPWRKVGGLLCESAGAGSGVDGLVVGIGINMRSTSYPPEVAARATSVETELGRPIDRAPVVVACLARLRAGVARLRADGHGWVCHEWRRFGRAGLDGAVVHWQDQSGARRGIARDLDAAGALVVESDGRVERLIAGEVIWDRLSNE